MGENRPDVDEEVRELVAQGKVYKATRVLSKGLAIDRQEAAKLIHNYEEKPAPVQSYQPVYKPDSSHEPANKPDSSHEDEEKHGLAFHFFFPLFMPFIMIFEAFKWVIALIILVVLFTVIPLLWPLLPLVALGAKMILVLLPVVWLIFLSYDTIKLLFKDGFGAFAMRVMGYCTATIIYLVVPLVVFFDQASHHMGNFVPEDFMNRLYLYFG